MKNNIKTYNISGKKIHCQQPSETNNQKHLSKGEQICKSLTSINANVYYNIKRIDKLNDEFMCSNSYYRTKSTSDSQKKPECSKNTYKALDNKLEQATKALHHVYDLNNQKDINLSELSYATQQSKMKLRDLYKFANNNHHDVNSAFELALYDTNMAGVGAFFSMLVPPLGFAVGVGNAMQNNEFNGKIARAIESTQDTIADIANVGETLSYLHGDVYA